MKRTALIFIAALSLPSLAWSAEPPVAGRDAIANRRPSVATRPAPPPPPAIRKIEPPRHVEPRRTERHFVRRRPIIIVPAGPAVGWTCETPRFECDLARPQPLGDDCFCRSPSGARRWGTVIE